MERSVRSHHGDPSESMLDDLLSDCADLLGDTNEYIPVEKSPKRK